MAAALTRAAVSVSVPHRTQQHAVAPQSRTRYVPPCAPSSSGSLARFELPRHNRRRGMRLHASVTAERPQPESDGSGQGREGAAALLPVSEFMSLPSIARYPPGPERHRRLGLAFTSLSLVNSFCLAVCWIVGARHSVEAFSVTALVLCIALLFDVVNRSIDWAEPVAGAPSILSRTHPLFLVCDSFGIVMVIGLAMEGLGWLTFASPTLSALVRAVWPLTIANQVHRLAVQSELWDGHRQAIALKEAHAMRTVVKSSALRLVDGGDAGGRPDSGISGLLAASVGGRLCARMTELWRNGQALAVAGSGHVWRRFILALSIADWGFLLCLWGALDPRSGGGSAAAALAGMDALLRNAIVPMVVLDGLRVGAKVMHGIALSHSGNPFTSQVPNVFGVAMPLGVSSPLSAVLFATNGATLVLSILTAAGGAGFGPLTMIRSEYFVRALLAARFTRLAFECAYLAASLTRHKPEQQAMARALHTNDAGTLMALYETNHLPARVDEAVGAERKSWVDTALSAVSSLWQQSPLGSARDDRGAEGAAGQAGQAQGGVDDNLRLDAFSSAVMAGLRGHLRGEEAITTMGSVFREVAADKNGEVTIEEMADWVEKEPSDGGGVRWRASVRRVLSTLASRVLISRQEQQKEQRRSAKAAGEAPANSEGGPQQQLVLQAAKSLEALSQLQLNSQQQPKQPPIRATERPAGTAVSLERFPSCLLPPRTTGKGLRLLSLEGGGIKGLTLVWQLMELERLSGRNIYDMFDLIGGTSTGGIIGLAIANRVPLADVEQLYYDVAREVFAKGSNLRQFLTGARTDSAPLIEILKKYLGDKPLRQGARHPHCFVVTTKVTGNKGAHNRLELRILRTYDSKAPSGGRDAKEGWLQWEAASATSAAPTIFQPYLRNGGETFIDGALSGNNNPSLLVLTEGLDYAAGGRIDLMVSLGCGDSMGVAEGGASLVYWVGQIINLAFDVQLQEERTIRLLHQFSPETRYLRLAPPTGNVALTEHKEEALAQMKADCLEYVRAHNEELTTLISWIEESEAQGNALDAVLSSAKPEDEGADSSSAWELETGDGAKELRLVPLI